MREWPVKSMWYTKHKGKTIEWIIDHDVTYFVWMVKTFQNVTPGQAQHYKEKYKKNIPAQYVQDVEPYEWKKGDPEEMYMELCDCQDLQYVYDKYRGRSLWG